MNWCSDARQTDIYQFSLTQLKVTNVSSSKTCAWAAGPTLRWNTLLLKSRLATLTPRETLGQNVTDAFTDRSPVSHSWPHIFSSEIDRIEIQNTMMTQLLSIVSAVFSASRVRSDLFCAQEGQREEMDRQGGRKKVWKMSDDAPYW